MLAIVVGGVAGLMCLVGISLLTHRRLFDPRIRANSSFGDTAILLMLFAQLLLGLCDHPVSLGHLDGHEMVKFMSWAQGILTLQPGVAVYVADAHPIFKVHLVLGMTIFLRFPFTRLVHVWSAPVWYLGRRGYQIVRSRDGRTPAPLQTRSSHASPAPRNAPRSRNDQRQWRVIPRDTQIAREVAEPSGGKSEPGLAAAARALVVRELLLQEVAAPRP